MPVPFEFVETGVWAAIILQKQQNMSSLKWTNHTKSVKLNWIKLNYWIGYERGLNAAISKTDLKRALNVENFTNEMSLSASDLNGQFDLSEIFKIVLTGDY